MMPGLSSDPLLKVYLVVELMEILLEAINRAQKANDVGNCTA